MLDPRPNVSRRNGLLTKNLSRQLISAAVRRVQLRHELTDQDLGDARHAADARSGSRGDQ